MLDNFQQIISELDAFVWGPPLLVLLLGTHLFYTIRLRFIQRHLGKAFRLMVQHDDNASGGNVSPIAALAVALASTLGTGNIIGVATAISLGGPGAVFWCMVTGFLGMATKYAESLLAVKYRYTDDKGEVHGGPMYTISRGIGWKWLGMAFCVIAAIAVMGTGNLVQGNAIASVVNKTYNVPVHYIGLTLAIIVGLVIIGGLKSIANVCTALVPLMGFAYIAGCIALLCFNRQVLGDSILLILKSAFTSNAAAGGIVGYGVMQASRYGIARGLFSNEAGMGSEPIVAATAQTKNAVRQGLISYAGTFCTIVICALTGLAVVSSVVAAHGTDAAIDIKSTLLTQDCFARIPIVGRYVLAFGIFAFASTTLLGWCYYGEQCIFFLFGTRKAILGYKIIYIIITYIGAVSSLHAVWNFSDLANGIMVIPNLVSLWMLHKVVIGETRKYLWSANLDEEDPELRA